MKFLNCLLALAFVSPGITAALSRKATTCYTDNIYTSLNAVAMGYITLLVFAMKLANAIIV
ncbi:hypothetical protein HYFRA_00006754 [Hymenoscyphus fraxineus]|uniref:Uncharacterized protein n=1 Tax=Hymenoscyphus fraxineus TaxID=746836 RepID=A0A9N9KUC2_9HELO|nr:hypothetical protein HYFRA_00006754 [Hymenoscyphus fraxineus]